MSIEVRALTYLKVKVEVSAWLFIVSGEMRMLTKFVSGQWSVLNESKSLKIQNISHFSQISNRFHKSIHHVSCRIIVSN